MKEKQRRLLLILNLILLDVGLVWLFLQPASEVTEKKVSYESGVYSNKKWNEPSLSYTKDIVPNEERAIEIAEAVMGEINNAHYQKENYEPFLVFYDEPDEVWIVHFWRKPQNGVYWTGGINIAIQREDGKVLRIWIDE